MGQRLHINVLIISVFCCGTAASQQGGSAATARALREAPDKGLPRARLLPFPSLPRGVAECTVG